jgi:FlaA1/EpsC-like NDP-sugar epimerase
LLRELVNNRELGCVPVGFVDDDPLKCGKLIHGLPVFEGEGSLTNVCRQQRAEEVLISTNRIPEERVRRIVSDCQKAKVNVKRMRIQIDHLYDSDEPAPQDVGAAS